MFKVGDKVKLNDNVIRLSVDITDTEVRVLLEINIDQSAVHQGNMGDLRTLNIIADATSLSERGDVSEYRHEISTERISVENGMFAIEEIMMIPYVLQSVRQKKMAGF